jgi:hypothetical protein
MISRKYTIGRSELDYHYTEKVQGLKERII